MNTRAHSRSFRVMRVVVSRTIIRKYPVTCIVSAVVLAFSAGVLCFWYLNQRDWGKIVLNLIAMMFSFEVTSGAMVEDEISLWVILAYAFTADVCTVTFDFIGSKIIIAIPPLKGLVDWFSRVLKAVWALIRRFCIIIVTVLYIPQLVRFIGFLVKRLLCLIPIIHRRWGDQNRMTRFIRQLHDRYQYFRENPSKAGIGVVYCFCLIPRFPPIPGGVSIAVFIVTYNKLGWRGWLAIGLGITTRSAAWLGFCYGLWNIGFLFS